MGSEMCIRDSLKVWAYAVFVSWVHWRTEANVYRWGVGGVDTSFTPTVISSIEPYNFVWCEGAEGLIITMVRVECAVEEICNTGLIGLDSKEFHE